MKSCQDGEIPNLLFEKGLHDLLKTTTITCVENPRDEQERKQFALFEAVKHHLKIQGNITKTNKTLVLLSISLASRSAQLTIP
jgi:hypothetical protein